MRVSEIVFLGFVILMMADAISAIIDVDVVTVGGAFDNEKTNNNTPTVEFVVSGENPTYTCDAYYDGNYYGSTIATNDTTYSQINSAIGPVIDGDYQWVVNCTNGTEEGQGAIDVEIDTTPPVVTPSSDMPECSHRITIHANLNEEGSSCILNWNSERRESMLKDPGNNRHFLKYVDVSHDGTYTYNISCNDTVYNEGHSDNEDVTIEDDMDGDGANCSIDCHDDDPKKVPPYDGLNITLDGTELCPGTFNLTDADSDGRIIEIKSGSLTVTCDSTIISGPGSGTSVIGIKNPGHSNVNVVGCTIRNFGTGIYWGGNSQNGQMLRDSISSCKYGLQFVGVDSKSNMVLDSALSSNTDKDTYSTGGSNNNLTNTTHNGAHSAEGNSLLAIFWYMDVHVKDINGVDLAGAEVTVKNSSDAVVYTGYTDASGNIRTILLKTNVTNPSGGFTVPSYTVKANKTGYNENSKNDPLESSVEIELVLTLIGQPNVVINEFMADPTSGSEWIELYNKGSTNATLTGWTITSTSAGLIYTFGATNSTIAAGNYSVVYLPAGSLHDDADTIRLINGSVVVGSVSYANNVTGKAPNPGQGDSIGRCPNGAGTGSDSSDFKKMLPPTPTPGTENNCLCSVYDADHDGYNSTYCGGIDCDDTDATKYPGAPCSRKCFDNSTYDSTCDCSGGVARRTPECLDEGGGGSHSSGSSPPPQVNTTYTGPTGPGPGTGPVIPTVPGPPEETGPQTPTKPACNENWECGEWGPCQNGVMSRTCTDGNTCGTNYDKPEDSRACIDGGIPPLDEGGGVTPGGEGGDLLFWIVLAIVVGGLGAIGYIYKDDFKSKLRTKWYQKKAGGEPAGDLEGPESEKPKPLIDKDELEEEGGIQGLDDGEGGGAKGGEGEPLPGDDGFESLDDAEEAIRRPKNVVP